MLGDVTGLRVLEVGCGSGDSIAQVVERGAQQVYGIDISRTQIALATERNRGGVESGKVRFFESPMEEALDLCSLDIVFSIYAIGWTVDPVATFRNMAGYLRPGGRFIWSWGHPLFPEVQCIDGRFVLSESYSYFNEQRQSAPHWCGSEGVVMQKRMLSSWVRDLTDAGFVIRQLLEPEAESCPERVFNNNRFIPMVRARLLPTTLIFVCSKP